MLVNLPMVTTADPCAAAVMKLPTVMAVIRRREEHLVLCAIESKAPRGVSRIIVSIKPPTFSEQNKILLDQWARILISKD